MKRGFRFAAGVAVIISAALLLLPFGQKAQALGNGSKAVAERLDHAKSQVQRIREMLADQLFNNERMAKTSTAINSNLTITASRTFSSNVTVNPGVTLTVSGGSLTVNGDLDIYGSLMVTGGSLVVNGDLNDYGAVSATGGSVRVNKAASGGRAGYTGGNITVGADDMSRAGSFSVGGSASVVISKVTSDTGLQIFNGYFGMNSASASCTVNGLFYTCGSSYDDSDANPLLTQGTFTVNGDFYVDSASFGHPYAPGKDFNSVIAGPARQVYIDDPSGSYFTNFSCAGASFTDGSVLSLHMDLARALSADCSGAMVFLEGKTNGKAVTVSAQSLVVNIGDDLNAQGSLTLGGDLDIEGTMEFSGGHMALDGSLVDNGRLDMSAGELSLNGNLSQYGQYNDQNDTCVFRASADFNTKITGAARAVHFDDPAHSYVRNLVLGNGDSLTVSGTLPLKDLGGDVKVPGPVQFSGTLGGNTLIVQGAAAIPAGATASIDSGTLFTYGDLTVSGALEMTGYDDRVIAGGNFTVNSADSALVSTLTGGRLSVQGSFTQSGAENSFVASGDHTTILCKTNGRQTVTFNSASSRFAHLAVINDKMARSDFSDTTRYADIVFSGTSLTGIDIGVGTLSPAFSGNTGTYSVFLPEGKNAASVTLHPKYPSDVVMDYSIDSGENQTASGGITVDGVPDDGKKTLIVTVSAINSVYDGTKDSPLTLQSVSYTFTIEAINPYLKSLNLPAGAAADKPFNPETMEYTVDLPETVASFAWAPAIGNPDSSLAIENDTASLSYGSSTTVSLALGDPKTYLIDTTTQDGKAGNRYTVTFQRRNPVAGISVYPGTLSPAFNPVTASYSVTIPSTISSVTVAAAPGANCSALTFDGEAETGNAKVIPVNPGCTVSTVIAATDADDRSVTSYTVRITRAIMITGISASPGPLDTAFSPAKTAYTVNVPATVSSVKITPAKFKTGVKAIYINGKKATSFTAKPKVGETLHITIQALASDGKTWSPVYTVNVARAPLITNIHVSAGSLTFSPTTYTYVVNIPADTSSITVSADQADVNSCTVAKTTLSPALNGSDSTTVKAIGRDGKTSTTYTVIAKRSVVTGIAVTGGTLSPAFDPAATSNKRVYTVNVPATTASVTLTPGVSPDCTSLKINGFEQNSITVPLGFGETKTVTIEGSTALGTAGKYQVNVTRAALVIKIAVGTKDVSLNQAFDPKVSGYTVNTTAGSIVIKATKASKGVKTLTINGKKVTSLTIKLPPGDSTITIVATATDGVTQSVYTVTVTRAVS